jgi:hypothetical protein
MWLRFYEYVLLVGCSFIQFNNDFVIFIESGPEFRVDDLPPLSALPQAIGGSFLTLWLVNGIFIASSLMGSGLYSYGNQFEDRGNVHD